MASNGNENCNANDSVWRFKGNGATSIAAAVTLRKLIFGMFKTATLTMERPYYPPSFTPSKHAPKRRKQSLQLSAPALPTLMHLAQEFSRLEDYLNGELLTKLRPENVYITGGCNQAIEIVIDSLAGNPEANILLPRPGYPHYDARAVCSGVKVRTFDLLPERDFEIDLDQLEAAADKNTIAMVLINPNNPCGNVYTYDHLNNIANMARKLGIMVISDEVYDQIVYGDRPFVPMGIFASIAPVITLGSISKGWVVPGWRLGWIAMNDSNGILKHTGVVQAIEDCLDLIPQPSFILQEALPDILEKTPKEFFDKKNKAMRRNVKLSCERLKEIPCLICPKRPESCSYLWLKLDTSMFDTIKCDFDFCSKLVTEESLVLVPGVALGAKNWVRISIGNEESELEDTFDRSKCFYGRHAISKEADKLNGLTTNQRVVSFT